MSEIPSQSSPTRGNGPRSHHPRALVTGGAGFLGSHLCDRLLAEDYEVYCLDNLLTGRRDNIRHLLDHPRFTFAECDVTKPIDLAGLLSRAGRRSTPGNTEENRVDYVLHLASPASPRDYARHPIHTLKLGALGTYYALGLAKSQGSVFLLASTSEVYGDPEVSPQPEGYWGHVNPIGPRSVYDEAKRFAEAITMAYHREHGVAVRIARIFNTYGERMRIDDGRALPNFMMQALEDRPLTVYGDGRQTRSLCYVSDLVAGLYRLLTSNETGPINLGNPEEATILELAEEVIALTGSRSSIVFEPLPADDPMRRRPDISKAITALGWRPQVSRRDGIERVVPYFRAELKRAGSMGVAVPRQTSESR
jgi:dTDP-glucose 4,6-dehydratase